MSHATSRHARAPTSAKQSRLVDTMQTTDPPPSGRSRVENEIIEILERVDRQPSVIEQVRASSLSRQTALRQTINQRRMVRLTPRVAILASLVLAIVAIALRGSVPWLAALMAVASFLALISLWFNRVDPSLGPPKWRGQDLGAGPTALEQWRARRGKPRD